MKFLVTDRSSIESGIPVRSAYIVISIHDPGRPKANVRKQPGLRDVLYLSFHDAEPTTLMALPANIKLMTPAQARKIWAFVDSHADIGAVVCHCEQGMSRSPAVAAALCKGMGGQDARFWQEYQPNQYVYQVTLKVRQEVIGR